MSDSVKVIFREIRLKVEYEEDEEGIRIYGVTLLVGIPVVPPIDIFCMFDQSATDMAELVEAVQIALEKEAAESAADFMRQAMMDREAA